MLSKISNSISAGSWRWLKPRKLVEGILGATRVSMDWLSGSAAIDAVKIKRHSEGSVGTVSVSLSNVTQVSVSAGTGLTAGSPDVAGVSDTAWKYRVTGLPVGIIALGKSPEELTAVIGGAFIEDAGGYLFCVDPASLGVVRTVGSNYSLCFCYLSDDTKVRHQPFLWAGRPQPCNDFDIQMIERCTSTLGVNPGTIIAATAGSAVSSSNTTVTAAWQENEKYYTATADGQILCTTSTPAKRLGDRLSHGELIGYEQSAYLVFTLKHMLQYVISDNDLSFTVKTVENVPYCLPCTDEIVYEADPYQPALQNTYGAKAIIGGVADSAGIIRGGYIHTPTLRACAETAGELTIDTTNSPLTATGELEVQNTLLPVAGSHLVCVVDVTCAIPDGDTTLKDTVPVNRDVTRTGVCVIYGSMEDRIDLVAGEAVDRIIASVVDQGTGGVIISRATVMHEMNGARQLFMTTASGDIHGIPPTAGMYLHTVAVLQGDHVYASKQLVHPSMVRAGGEFVIKITQESTAI